MDKWKENIAGVVIFYDGKTYKQSDYEKQVNNKKGIRLIKLFHEKISWDQINKLAEDGKYYIINGDSDELEISIGELEA